ncbi:hypothetical protein GIB67_032453 [Kingdonia uniflora]|uniref:Pentatricopeptide repeat-containing protein n=1 Tax=Kingdonia uniflora TaxID=39325 RepID=A0A7J7L7L6_9MAGN|nr:hypothetical protein GIB67_032453 [Kingdonia uniflora]
MELPLFSLTSRNPSSLLSLSFTTSSSSPSSPPPFKFSDTHVRKQRKGWSFNGSVKATSERSSDRINGDISGGGGPAMEMEVTTFNQSFNDAEFPVWEKLEAIVKLTYGVVKWIGGCLVTLFEMGEEEINADEVTLVGVVCAYSHRRLVRVGREIFYTMIEWIYGFHRVLNITGVYSSSRTYRYLQEAFEVIKRLPFEPSEVMWGALLVGCRALGDLELSEFATRKLVKLEPGNSAYYALLSNLYIEMGRIWALIL